MLLQRLLRKCKCITMKGGRTIISMAVGCLSDNADLYLCNVIKYTVHVLTQLLCECKCVGRQASCCNLPHLCSNRLAILCKCICVTAQSPIVLPYIPGVYYSSMDMWGHVV